MADAGIASSLSPAPESGPPGSRRFRVVPALVVVLLVLVAGGVLLAVRHHDDGAPDHRVSVARGTGDDARLDVVGGVDSLRITAGDLGDDLLVADTPDAARAVPDVTHDAADRATVSTRSAPDGAGPVVLSVRLNRGLRWSVAVHGGAQRVTLDLTGAGLASLQIDQGVAALDVRLPRPRGGLVTRISGGAGAVAVHLPPGVPARVTFASGGGQAVVDGERRSGLSAGTVMTTPDWLTGTRDRTDVVLAAGVGALTLDRPS